MADDLKDTLTNAAPVQRRSLLKGTAGILAAGMFPAVALCRTHRAALPGHRREPGQGHRRKV